MRILQERISFIGYDAHCQENLKALKALLEPAIGGILDEFYQFMRERPETRDLLPNAEVQMRAQQAQQEHWLQLLSGASLDAAHCERVMQIGHTHERIGLGLGTYLSSYCIVLNRFCERIVAQYRADPARQADMLQSLHKVVFLDISFVIESYLDAKNASIRRILLNADRFIAGVEQIESELSGLSGCLRPSTESLAASLGVCLQRLDALRQELSADEINLRQIESVHSILLNCEDGVAALQSKCSDLSHQLERLTMEVLARRARHRLNFEPAEPQGLSARLKKAAHVLFSSQSSA